MKKKNDHTNLVLSASAGMLIISICTFIYIYNDIFPDTKKFTAEVWGTVSDWIIIAVTVVTAVFLYRTLQSQQEEIERNKRDVEFNRILDAVYRQLEFTRQIHLNQINDPYGLIKLNDQISTKTNFLGFDVIVGEKKRMSSLYNMTNNVHTFTVFIANDLKLFNNLIYISNLEDKEINILTNIINNNFLNEYKNNIDDLNKVFQNGLSEDEFVNILDYGYQLNNVLNMGGDKTEHHKHCLAMYKEILVGLELITDFTFENKTKEQIDEYKTKLGLDKITKRSINASKNKYGVR